MFRSNSEPIDSALQQLNKELNRFTEHLRFQAIRAGIVAAGQPIKSLFTQLASAHVGTKAPTRRLHGTNIVVARPRLKDSITNKVWRMPDGTGYVNYVGPVSIEVPHAHWFERGPKNRYTKAGAFRGSMPDYHLLSRTYSGSINQAVTAFESTVKQKMESFVGQ